MQINWIDTPEWLLADSTEDLFKVRHAELAGGMLDLIVFQDNSARGGKPCYYAAINGARNYWEDQDYVDTVEEAERNAVKLLDKTLAEIITGIRCECRD